MSFKYAIGDLLRVMSTPPANTGERPGWSKEHMTGGCGLIGKVTKRSEMYGLPTYILSFEDVDWNRVTMTDAVSVFIAFEKRDMWHWAEAWLEKVRIGALLYAWDKELEELAALNAKRDANLNAYFS
jgi:hypothetical protein